MNSFCLGPWILISPENISGIDTIDNLAFSFKQLFGSTTSSFYGFLNIKFLNIWKVFTIFW